MPGTIAACKLRLALFLSGIALFSGHNNFSQNCRLKINDQLHDSFLVFFICAYVIHSDVTSAGGLFPLLILRN